MELTNEQIALKNRIDTDDALFEEWGEWLESLQDEDLFKPFPVSLDMFAVYLEVKNDANN